MGHLQSGMGHDFCDWDAKPKGLLDFLQEFDMQDVLSRKRSPRLIPQVSYLVDPSDAISTLRASQPRDLISAEKECRGAAGVSEYPS